MFGIDFGGSTLKVVRSYPNGKMEYRLVTNNHDKPPEDYISELVPKDQEQVVCTGGKSMLLPDVVDGLKVIKVHEFDAISAYIRAQYDTPKLVTSLGTGVPFLLVVKDFYQHLGGTSVGGGTLLGLGRRLTGVKSYEELELLAQDGDTTQVNLTVGDIVGSGIGNLPAEASASYFAKSSGNSKDMAAAIFQMVSETIGMLALQIMERLEVSELVGIGRMANSTPVTSRLQAMFRMVGKQLVIPSDATWATILGAIETVQPT